MRGVTRSELLQRKRQTHRCEKQTAGCTSLSWHPRLLSSAEITQTMLHIST